MCPLNTPRAWPCGLIMDNKIYVIGGYNGSNRLRSAEFYDPDGDTWTFISNMNCRRAGCAAAWVSQTEELVVCVWTSGQCQHTVIGY